MKRFRFPLQAVVTLREHRKLRAMEAFAAATQAVVRAQAQLAQQQAHVASVGDALVAGRRGTFSPASQAEATLAYRAECAIEAEEIRRVQTATAQMEQRRDDYLFAHRQAEAIKRLEEKARELHRRETARAEQIEMDDFASRRARPDPLEA